MENFYLKNIKHNDCKGERICNWDFISVPNTAIRVYYKQNDELGMGFYFYAIESVGYEPVPETENNEWHPDYAFVASVYHGTAYYDGIRHLYMGDEATKNDGYHYYAKLMDNVRTLLVIRALEIKYCRDIETDEETIIKENKMLSIQTEKYWMDLVDQLNKLHMELSGKPEELKTEFSLSYGGILNAYREGDLTFNDAVEKLKELGKEEKLDGGPTVGHQPKPNSELSANPPKGGSGVRFTNIDFGRPGGDKTAKAEGFVDETGRFILEKLELSETESQFIKNENKDVPLESFWKLREEKLNAHLKELGVEEKISLQTPDERTRFIEMLKDFEREDALDQRKEEIKKLDIADKDILLVKNESPFTCERIHKSIEKLTGKKVFVISLQEPAELIKLSSEALDQIGLQKKDA